MTFEELGLKKEVLKSITKLGFESPTPIQEQAIPHLLQDESDFVGLAQTGTGKTAAFGLPLVSKVDDSMKVPQGLVICPTRELCLQISKDIQAFSSCLPHMMDKSGLRCIQTHHHNIYPPLGSRQLAQRM